MKTNPKRFLIMITLSQRIENASHFYEAVYVNLKKTTLQTVKTIPKHSTNTLQVQTDKAIHMSIKNRKWKHL